MLKRKVEGDIVYYNAIINGLDEYNQTLSFYEDQRTKPLLYNPNEYYLSVIRFSLSSGLIPLFVCQVVPNPGDANDPNFTPYFVTLRANGNEYTRNLVYVPQSDQNAPNPPSSTISQDNTTGYYFIYSYQHFIKMINDALALAMGDLITANAAFTGIEAPYFKYDEKNRLFSLITSTQEVGGTRTFLTQYGANGFPNVDPQPANTIQIFLGSRLYHFLEAFKTFKFSNIPFITQFSNIQPILPVYLYAVDDLKGNYLYPAVVGTDNTTTQNKLSFVDTGAEYTASPPYYVMTQEYEHVGSFNSINKIVILTSLPVIYENIPSLNRNGELISGSASNKILTDFVLDISKQGNQRQRLIFEPSSEYRYIELNSTTPIDKIDFRIFWQDRLQNLYPMTIPYGQSNTLKIMFISKRIVQNF